MTASASKWTGVSSALAGIALLAAAILGTGAHAGSPSEPLTNEDVVRMTAGRVPPEEIVRTIRRAPSTAFDLDPEMVEELRKAGVVDAVIEAMRAARMAPAPLSPDTSLAGGFIDLVFQKEKGSDDAGSTAIAPAKDYNDRLTSLAFFLYCTDQFHVLDLWESRTPLPPGFPRHHLIWFHEATKSYKQNRRGGLVSLKLPDQMRLEIQEGIHPLELGVVARVGDLAWEQLAKAAAKLEVRTGQAARLVVKVRTHKAGFLNIALGGTPAVTCEILEPAQPPQTAGSPPP